MIRGSLEFAFEMLVPYSIMSKIFSSEGFVDTTEFFQNANKKISAIEIQQGKTYGPTSRYAMDTFLRSFQIEGLEQYMDGIYNIFKQRQYDINIDLIQELRRIGRM